MTATVVSLSGVSRSAFSRQNPGASSTGPHALWHSYPRIMPPPIIRSPHGTPFEFCLSLYSILHTQYSHSWPTGQLINRSTGVPLTFALLHRSSAPLCTFAPFGSSPYTPYSSQPVPSVGLSALRNPHSVILSSTFARSSHLSARASLFPPSKTA